MQSRLVFEKFSMFCLTRKNRFVKIRLQTIPEENAKAAAACSNLRFVWNKKTDKQDDYIQKQLPIISYIQFSAKVSCTVLQCTVIYNNLQKVKGSTVLRELETLEAISCRAFEVPSLQHVSPRLYAWDSPSLTIHKKTIGKTNTKCFRTKKTKKLRL